jgi:prophage tail gpP-like protein/phage tail protein X
VQQGDTLTTIARRVYGDDKLAGNILRANPGTTEPLTPGTTVTVPDIPDAPTNRPTATPAASDNEVAVLIDGKRFRHWTQVQVSRSLDAVDGLTLSAPFDHTAEGFREMFQPFSFKSVEVTVGGSPLFTGTMVNPTPIMTANGVTLSVTAYSLPGVLADCTAPVSLFPLEFNGLAIKDVATKLCEPFGITVAMEGDPGAVFGRVRIETEERVWPFLMRLAQQRGLLLSSSSAGALRIYSPSTPTQPSAVLRQGESPLQGVTPLFNAQEVYSSITGLEPVRSGRPGSKYTARVPRVGTVRPYTYRLPDTLDADARTAVEGKAGRMYGAAVGYTAPVATWRTPAGELWSPGMLVQLEAPDAMIYRSYGLQVRTVTFNRSASSETAVLGLVLPGAFTGQLPEALPWD